MKFFAAAVSALTLAVFAPPALAQDAGDAARLEAAEATVDYVFPKGTYERMMRGTMEQMTGQMMDAMVDMPMRDIVGQMGVPKEDLDKLGKGTLREMMAILDPAFMERMQLTNGVIMNGMVDVMTTMEPAMREGLAEAYADRFSAAELNELTAFFATPTGGKYAANSMMIFMDPKMMAKMQESMPRIMEAMPALIGKAQEATAHLPKPRKPEDLSEAERKQLMDLAGAD
ncbi:DUF2059 domain-containing protein [Croceicoccus naphthovorans]|uniref:DUF2059 domain-containing protein n=1 Tax=Croceicoccus naphthovorans TaxID=1348774 RepID=A0A0G3XBY8_9SPHN|nr:DUF2059 domain-containing protein [Croceicoccus naphthovorans]AKM09040.1 hypothetical protein AB433_02140 [Croceicoccus naphthovorans]MBB3991464.1 hypothetical protein [Croceicoccus naphthovorans]